MRILTYTVTPEEDGRMVKGILRGSLQLSYTLLKSLKWRENAILLNGQSVHVNTIVHAGDTVIVVSTFEGMNDLQDIFLPTNGGSNE